MSYAAYSDCSESYLPNSHETSGQFDVTKTEIEIPSEDTPMTIVKSKSTPLPVTSNEFSKEADLKKPETPKGQQANSDMFFCCADWETQIDTNEKELLNSQ